MKKGLAGRRSATARPNASSVGQTNKSPAVDRQDKSDQESRDGRADEGVPHVKEQPFRRSVQRDAGPDQQADGPQVPVRLAVIAQVSDAPDDCEDGCDEQQITREVRGAGVGEDDLSRSYCGEGRKMPTGGIIMSCWHVDSLFEVTKGTIPSLWLE